MKKFFEFSFKRPILVLIFIISAFSIFSCAIKPSQSTNHAILRAVGVDKIGDEYEVSILSFTSSSTQNFSENYTLTSAKGESITQALQLAGDYLGKQIALAHLSTIVVNLQASENLTETLDYFAREYVVNNSTNIICTNTTAKEFLEKTLPLESEDSSNESNIVTHNAKFVTGFDSNIESVYESANKPSRTTFVSYLKLADEGVDLSGENNSASSDSSGGSGNSESGQKKEDKKLENDGSVVVLVKGKNAGILESEDVRNLSWGTPNTKKSNINLQNYSDENLQDATVVLVCQGRRVKKEAYFDGDIPCVKFSLSMQLDVMEILQKNALIKTYIPKTTHFNDKMRRDAKEKIKSDFYTSFEKIKQLNADPFNFYEMLEKKDKNKFKNYIYSLENQEDYMKGIKVVMEINLRKN